MKAKIISIAVFIILAYVLPLLGRTELLPTFTLAVLSAFVVVLFATQPPLRISEAKSDRSSDQNSVILIMLGYFAAQLASVIEWAYFPSVPGWTWDWQTITGFSLMAGGTIFRVWCIRTLGKFFTSTVKVQEDQRVITSGAYRVVRHPSYSGAFIAATGSSLFLHAYTGLVITIVVLSIAYYFRIRSEEETLVKEFGDEYRDYQAGTRKLIPFIY